MSSKIDHLVIGARTLAEGVDYVSQIMGVAMPYGGEHVKMGTHNHLMQLGNETFLEVIAINEEMSVPTRPRWYGLDDAYVRHKIAQQPALLTWVINTGDIQQLIKKASFSLGRAEAVSRGNLNWLFGLPNDGRLLGSGMLPYAIEWQTETHPSKGMADLACRLESLHIYHPYPAWLQQALVSVEALPLVKIHPLAENQTAYLRASIQTPKGLVSLQSVTAF